MGNRYLEKHALFGPLIKEPAGERLFLSIVIPCYNEPRLHDTLYSLLACTPSAFPAEVIVVINAAHNDHEAVMRNKETEAAFDQWVKPFETEKLRFHKIIKNDLEPRHAGVGLARKIGMDEAVRRFDSINQKDGVMVCLDADCTVSENYLTELERFFISEKNASGCSLYFEHPLGGNEFEEEVYQAIYQYELYLRYYHSGLQWAGYPYAYQTIGSCMAVRSSTYQKAGGMNRRKAGEDFYFLHKIFPSGNFFELNSTCVYPSPRPSQRVPFGTGSTIHKVIHRQYEITAFSLQTFADLKKLNSSVSVLFNSGLNEWLKPLPETVKRFFEIQQAAGKLIEIKANAASPATFAKRFYSWFDGLLLLQFFHFCRDYFYRDEPLEEAASRLIQMHYRAPVPSQKHQVLHFLREQQKMRSGETTPATFFSNAAQSGLNTPDDFFLTQQFNHRK